MGLSFLVSVSECPTGLETKDLRPGVTGVVFWYVQSVNRGTDSWVLTFPVETTVILMLGGTQVDNSVILRKGFGGVDDVAGTAFADVGIAFAMHCELNNETARISRNMAEDDMFGRLKLTMSR